MKSCRIYGTHRGEPFCKFPNGDNIMQHIRIDIYKNKKIRSVYGKLFQKMSPTQWKFFVGDIECILTQKKPFKFKVHDEDTKVFENNQVAGVFYMHKPYGERSMEDRIDDERVRLGDIGNLPFREQDSELKMIVDNYPSFPSPITKLSTRNREILSVISSDNFKMEEHEIMARNCIVISHYNSWVNRFGKKSIDSYIFTDHFFLKLFEASDQYFFGGILCKLADWKISFKKIEMIGEDKTMVGIHVSKSVLKACKDILSIIRLFQGDLCRIVIKLLTASSTVDRVKVTKAVAFNLFGLDYTHSGLLKCKTKNVPRKEYKNLYHTPCPGLIMLE
jgi:hypothetical protein